jgi:EAL domain-containing protein (putative c-di-GMP-specific phosphodiesterase class I)
VKIALDDFGTGFSSLSYLRKFPIDILKIDRSFVLEMESDFECQMIVKAIVNLAKALSLKVVVEGVETKGQFELVNHFKCDFVQGYYFSKPVKPNEIRLNFQDMISV